MPNDQHLSATQTAWTSPPQPPTGRGVPVLSWLPLAAAYLAAPLAVLAGKLANKAEAFQIIAPQGMALWTGLAAVALLYSVFATARQPAAPRRDARPALDVKSRLIVGIVLAAALVAAVRFLSPRIGSAQDLAPLLVELRLPALALFAGLWVWQFGCVRRATLARLGAGLGALMLLDFLLTAIMARSIVVGGGFLLGVPHPGGQDVLAFLLVLALCAALAPPAQAESPLPHPAEATPSGLARWLILAGLFVSFSLPGMAAAGLVLLVLDGTPLRHRLALVCSLGLMIWISMILPLAHWTSGREELNLGWHFSATLEALGQTPSGPFLGLPLSEPVALAVNEDLQGLDWDPEAMGLPVYIFDLPSSGLRLLAAWGAGGPILVLGAVLLCALRTRSRFGAGLALGTVVCGAFSPVLHVPASCAGLWLVLFSAARAGGGAADASQAAATGPAATPDAAGRV